MPTQAYDQISAETLPDNLPMSHDPHGSEGQPGALRDAAERDRRRAMLSLPHIAPLTAYAASLRVRPGAEVPEFDPLDGGIEATILFLLEKPGPLTSITRPLPNRLRQGSGFISRDNAGATAEALRRFMLEAGLPRRHTVIWNLIPWWNGTIGITAAERADGARVLPGLLSLLPRLHTAVLVGQTAARARPALHGLRVLESAHPSPQVRAGYRTRWDAIPAIWRQAAQSLTPESSVKAGAVSGPAAPA